MDQHPTMTALPVLIIHTGDPDAEGLARFGSYAEQLRRAAGLAAQAVHTVAVHRGETLPDADRYAAALITGSPAMVTDRAPWSEDAARWLADAVPRGLPVFGVCYGHQLLAHALGGVVADNPRGREVGTQTVTLAPGARQDPLLADAPDAFPGQMQHAQSVIAPPPGARVLAASAMDPHQMLRYGPHAVSVQFHPEFDEAVTRADLQRHAGRYRAMGMDIEALARSVRPSPYAAQLVRRFLQLHARAAA
jgi:GMP synthase - Glutamine amidotransferase domain